MCIDPTPNDSMTLQHVLLEMKIESINISGVKTIDYNGDSVTTGIFKKPVSGIVNVTAQGIIGDAQADLINHGGIDKALYGFSGHHYRHWQTELNTTLLFGSFGENLTVNNLYEDKTFIGDLFSLGSCIVQVSQPRVPCFKLAIVLNNKNAVKAFTKYGNTGVYFRVVQAGSFSVEDRLIKIDSIANSVSIKDLFSAKFDKSFVQKEAIFAKARKLKALSNEWREKVK